MRVAPVKVVVKSSPKIPLVSQSGDSFEALSQPTPVSPSPASDIIYIYIGICRHVCDIYRVFQSETPDFDLLTS